MARRYSHRSVPPVPTSLDDVLVLMARQIKVLEQRVNALEARPGLPSDYRFEVGADGAVVIRRSSTGATSDITGPLT